jgi:hypothetical protein
MTDQATRRLLCASVALGLATTTGCYKTTFVNPAAVIGTEDTVWNNFFLWGIAGTVEVDVRESCPSGEVARVETGANFATGFFTLLTAGLYAPRRTIITCAATRAGALAPSYQIELDASGIPVRVEGKLGRRSAAGTPQPVAGAPGKYSVALEEVPR